MNKLFFLLFGLILLSAGCADKAVISPDQDTPVLPDEPYAYHEVKLPSGTNMGGNVFFDDLDITGAPVNTTRLDMTPWGATLGRVLFYDKNLSLNNTISCASCHHQDKAFSDGQQFSTGFQGRITPRNSMAIINPITQNNLFWDSRSRTISDLSLKPVQNHIEMGMENLDLLVTKLEEIPYYKPLFKKAFNSEYVTKERISSALSQFIGSITTSRSRFDQSSVSGFSNFSELEKLGMNLFNSDKAKCASCHGGGNMAAQDGPNDPYGGGGAFNSSGVITDLRGATNIGLDLVYRDNGLGDGRFRIPSLRNIELTAPYMHDGRFKTLDEVLDHYTSGIKPHKHLDVKFTDGHGNLKMLNLNDLEKKAIIAFLRTLTDKEMTTDPKYSNPFKP
jgi:cytochrome c peroxidase